MQCGQENIASLNNYLEENVFIMKIIFYKNKPLQTKTKSDLLQVNFNVIKISTQSKLPRLDFLFF